MIRFLIRRGRKRRGLHLPLSLRHRKEFTLALYIFIILYWIIFFSFPPFFLLFPFSIYLFPPFTFHVEAILDGPQLPSVQMPRIPDVPWIDADSTNLPRVAKKMRKIASTSPDDQRTKLISHFRLSSILPNPFLVYRPLKNRRKNQIESNQTEINEQENKMITLLSHVSAELPRRLGLSQSNRRTKIKIHKDHPFLQLPAFHSCFPRRGWGSLLVVASTIGVRNREIYTLVIFRY